MGVDSTHNTIEKRKKKKTYIEIRLKETYVKKSLKLVLCELLDIE